MDANSWLIFACLTAVCLLSYEAGKFVMQIKLRKVIEEMTKYISNFAETLRTKQKEGDHVETNNSN
mgnify:CR=1 FL=1